MEVLFSIAIGLIAGLLMTRLMKPLGLPAVTGYLIAGILVGPYCLGKLGAALGFGGLGFVSSDAVSALSVISDVALGFIAFSIGNEFRLSQLKKTGRQATIIGIFQAVFTTLVVGVALVGFALIPGSPISVPVALTLAAIASATAPATTLMVVHQYKAHGPVTDVLLPVVALDDAVGLVLFAVCFGVARTLQNGEFSLVSVICNPLIEIVLSLALGFVMGLLFTFLEKFFNSGSKRLSLCVTFVLLAVALSQLEFHFGELHVAFSPLLVCMMMGTVFCNICDFSEDMMESTERWTAPVYVIFFVLSGAALELNVFLNAGIVLAGVIYIATRTVGKYYGAYISAGMAGAPEMVKKYLGITLFPQEGVALGMSLMAMALGPVTGGTVRSITLFSVMIYELVAPLLSKVALQLAGEIHPKSTKVGLSEDH